MFAEFSEEFKRLQFKTTKKITDDVIYAYHAELKKYELSDFKVAVDKVITDGEKFPTATELRNIMARDNRYKKVEANPGWSFECKQCGSSFWAFEHDLNALKTFRCDSCEFYYNRRMTWNGQHLNKQMEQSKIDKEAYSLV